MSPKTMLILFTSVQLITYLDRGIVSTELADIQDAYGLSGLEAGTLAGAYMVGYMTFSPVFANMADRVSPLTIMAFGLSVWGAAVVCTGLSLEYVTILLARTATGVGEASFACLAPPLIDCKAPPESRSKWMSVFYLAIPVGYALGFLLAGQWQTSGAMDPKKGWRIPFIVTGAAIAPCVLYLYCKSGDPTLSYKHDPRRSTASGDDGIGEDETEDDAKMPLYHPADDGLIAQDMAQPNPVSFMEKFKLVINNGVYILIILGYAAQTFVVGGFAYWGIRYVESGLGLSESAATLSFGGLTVFTGVVGTAFGGFALDRMIANETKGKQFDKDLENLVAVDCATRLMFFCGLGSLPCCVLGLALFKPAPFFLLVGVAEFLIFACLTPINSSIVWVMPHKVAPLAMALSVFSNHAFGDAVSPIIIGGMLDQTKYNWRIVFVIISLWLIWPVLLWFPAWRISSARKKVTLRRESARANA